MLYSIYERLALAEVSVVPLSSPKTFAFNGET